MHCVEALPVHKKVMALSKRQELKGGSSNREMGTLRNSQRWGNFTMGLEDTHETEER